MNILKLKESFEEAFFDNGEFTSDGEFEPNTDEKGTLSLKQESFEKLHKEFLKINAMSTFEKKIGMLNSFSMSTIECITFKKAGNCFTNGGIKYKDCNGNIVTELTHSINLIGGYVIDLELGINGMAITDYVDKLYEYNNYANIRIDYTMSRFMAYEDGDALTDAMCKHLRTREGLAYVDFKRLNQKAKDLFENSGKILDNYDEQVSELYKKFKGSKRGLNVYKDLCKLYEHDFKTISVTGDFNLLSKENSIQRHTTYTVGVVGDLQVLDPAHGWESMPADVWISLISIFNPSGNFTISFSSESLVDGLNLSTYGDIETINGKDSFILNSVYTDVSKMSLLLSILESIEDASVFNKIDKSCLLATIMCISNVGLRDRLLKLGTKEI